MTDERSVTMTKQGEAPAVQVPGRIPDQPCADCLDQSPAAELRRPGVPRRVAFWLLAFVFAATMLGTTLPTPLYDIYQVQWHFSAAIVTVTFAVYAAGVLLTLLLTGTSLGSGRPQASAGRGPRLQRAEHRGVHPGPQRGGAYGRPDPFRVLGRTYDRHGDGRAH